MSFVHVHIKALTDMIVNLNKHNFRIQIKFTNKIKFSKMCLFRFNDVAYKGRSDRLSFQYTEVGAKQFDSYSPKRKQKLDMTPFLTSTPLEGSKIFDFETYDDMAYNPNHSSQNTFSEESVDDAMTQLDTPMVGEGQ